MAKDTLSESFSNMLMDFLKDKFNNTEFKDENEAKELLEKIKKIDISDLFKKFLDDLAEENLNGFKSDMYESVMSFRAIEQEFLARQEQKWYKAFVASEALYILVVEAVEDYSAYVNSMSDEEKEDKIWEYTALRYIHGRALQQYLEIITLMKNGFADGAYARWRSMYELAVISSFINKYGEKVAKAFIDASVTDDRYEWARESGIFTKKHRYITFNDIQKNCDMNSDIWQQQYDLANKTVHASPQGTFNRLSTMGDVKVIPIGRSDYGITTPAEHSAISLSQISAFFLTVFPYSTSIIAINNINDWIDVIRELYFKCHDEVFPDDEPLWEDDSISDTSQTKDNQSKKGS